MLILTPDKDINRPLVDTIYRERKHFDNIDTLDVLLDSSGGDIEAAYQLVNFMRRKCKKLRVFVPDWAKSAATLFTLGADEIWMSEVAELGPLDAQIPDPRDPDAYISALDEFRAIDYLRQHSFEIFDEFSKLLVRRSRLRIANIIDRAIQYSTGILSPLYSQVDPLHFGGAHRSLENSIAYGMRVMSRHAYSTWSQKRIDALLKALTWAYSSHSFVIDYVEAKQLGLNAELMSDEMTDNAVEILHGVRQCVGFIDAEAVPHLLIERARAGGQEQ